MLNINISDIIHKPSFTIVIITINRGITFADRCFPNSLKQYYRKIKYTRWTRSGFARMKRNIAVARKQNTV